MDFKHFVLELLLFILPVLSSMESQESTQTFDCCELPIKIEIDRSLDPEIHIGNQTVVTTSRSTFDVVPPFTIQENSTLILNECVDFVQKIFVKNKVKKGFTEKNIHHRSLPCNKTVSGTAAGDPSSSHPGEGTEEDVTLRQSEHTGVIVTVTVVLLVLVGAIGVVVYCVKKKPEEANGVV